MGAMAQPGFITFNRIFGQLTEFIREGIMGFCEMSGYLPKLDMWQREAEKISGKQIKEILDKEILTQDFILCCRMRQACI